MRSIAAIAASVDDAAQFRLALHSAEGATRNLSPGEIAVIDTGLEAEFNGGVFLVCLADVALFERSLLVAGHGIQTSDGQIQVPLLNAGSMVATVKPGERIGFALAVQPAARWHCDGQEDGDE